MSHVRLRLDWKTLLIQMGFTAIVMILLVSVGGTSSLGFFQFLLPLVFITPMIGGLRQSIFGESLASSASAQAENVSKIFAASLRTVWVYILTVFCLKLFTKLTLQQNTSEVAWVVVGPLLAYFSFSATAITVKETISAALPWRITPFLLRINLNFLIGLLSAVLLLLVFNKLALILANSLVSIGVFVPITAGAVVSCILANLGGQFLGLGFLTANTKSSLLEEKKTKQVKSKITSNPLLQPIAIPGINGFTFRLSVTFVILCFCSITFQESAYVLYYILCIGGLTPLIQDAIIHLKNETHGNLAASRLAEHAPSVIAAFARTVAFAGCVFLLHWLSKSADFWWAWGGRFGYGLSLLYFTLVCLKISISNSLRGLLPSQIFVDVFKAPPVFWVATLIFAGTLYLTNWIFDNLIVSGSIHENMIGLLGGAFSLVYLCGLIGCFLGKSYLQRREIWQWEKNLRVSKPVTLSGAVLARSLSPDSPAGALRLPEITSARKLVNTLPSMEQRGERCPLCDFDLRISGISFRHTHSFPRYLKEHQLVLGVILGVATVIIQLIFFPFERKEMGTNDTVFLSGLFVFVPYLLITLVIHIFPRSKVVDCPKCDYFSEEPI